MYNTKFNLIFVAFVRYYNLTCGLNLASIELLLLFYSFSNEAFSVECMEFDTRCNISDAAMIL